MEAVQKRITDPKVLKLIRRWLKAGVMEDGVVREAERGTPQGGVISPLLSNIYLGELDRLWGSLPGDSGNDPDPVRGRLRGDVPHGGGGEGSEGSGGGNPRAAEAEAASGQDTDCESQQERGDVHVPGMHAQEGEVAGIQGTVVPVPMAEPEKRTAHPGTGERGDRPSAVFRDESASGTCGTSAGTAGVGGILSNRERLDRLCEGGAIRAGSAQPSSPPPQPARVSDPDVSRSATAWAAPFARHDSVSWRRECRNRIDSR